MRIVCIGTEGSKEKDWDMLTRPGSVRRENSRAYRFPTPGRIYRYGGADIMHEESRIAGHQLVPAYPGGPAIQGYGIFVIGDSYTKVVRPPAEGTGLDEKLDMESIIISARDRALDMILQWTRCGVDYGAMLMKGEFPTDEELRVARGNRELSAKNRLNHSIAEVKLAGQGHKGVKREYSESDRAWAFEYGIVLPQTVDSLQRTEAPSREETPCPECDMLISGNARRCRHCHAQFGMAVSEFLAAGGASEDLQEPPKRGPGRPRKETVEVG
jgi:hypothetical protein